jgi:hypothetical protein
VTAHIGNPRLRRKGLRLQVPDDRRQWRALIRRHQHKSGTGAPPVRRNAWKRAGGIGDRLWLREDESIEPSFPHQLSGAVPVEKSRHR